MNNPAWKVEFHPRISTSIYGMIALIPFGIFIIGASMTPQDGSIGQTTTLLSIALLIPLVLIGLTMSIQKQLMRSSFIRIENTLLTLKHKEQQKELELKDIESISLHSKFGFATQWKVKKKEQDVVSFNMGGVISDQQMKELESILSEHHIILHA